MKSFFRLLQNELIKISKQLSYKIVAIIMAVLIVLTPLLYWGLEKLTDDAFISYYYDYYSDDWSYYTEEANAAMESEDYSFAAKMLSKYDEYVYFGEMELDNDSLEYTLYSSTLFDALYDYEFTKIAADVLKTKTFDSLPEDFRYELASYYSVRYLGYEINSYTKTYGNVTYDYSDSYETLSGTDISADFPDFRSEMLTSEVLTEMLSDAEKNVNEIKTKISSFSLQTYYSDIAKENEDEIAEINKEIEEISKSLPGISDKIEKAQTENRKRYFEVSLEVCNAKKAALAVIVAGDCEEWIRETYTALCNAGDVAPGYIPDIESDYQPDKYDYMSYSEYCESMQESYDNAILAMNECLCSIENNAPINGSGEGTARFNFESHMASVGSLIVIVIVVLAGTVLASEYSSGSIRLLLIRPCSRRKILAAKLTAVLICGIAMTAFSALAIYIEDGLFYGFDGYAYSRVYCFGGSTHVISGALASLIAVGQDIVSMLPLVMIAFFMSVLIRRSALSIIVPIIINVFSSLIQSLCLYAYYGKFTLLKYTILPYMNLSWFRVSPAADYFYNVDFSLSTTTYATYDYVAYSLPWLGAAQLIIITVALGYFSFLCFRKQQVKN